MGVFNRIGHGIYDILLTMKKLSLTECQAYLSSRPRAAHKGEFGHVLVVGGDYGMGGACRLAGEAALRAGAGLVTLATRPEYAFAITGNCPELMCHGIETAEDLDPLLARATVVAVGSGLGQKTWGASLFARVLESALPLVVDADALNQLALNPQTRANWILTPHPGEAARLLEKTIDEIQTNRIKAVQLLQAQYHGIIVLKGAGTLVTNSEGVSVCTAGNPGMATAGMGDVLAGVIAALVAQGLSLQEAASLGVVVHATAGDIAAKLGERGMMARDLLAGIRTCLN